jgi:hypothetical protein
MWRDWCSSCAKRRDSTKNAFALLSRKWQKTNRYQKKQKKKNLVFFFFFVFVVGNSSESFDFVFRSSAEEIGRCDG